MKILSLSKPCFVQFFCMKIDAFHSLSESLWSCCGAYVATTRSHLRFFASFFQLAQIKAIDSLSLFYTKKWKKGHYACNSTLICCGPGMQWPPIFGAWFCHVQAAAKSLFEKAWYIWMYLPQSNTLAEYWSTSIFTNTHCVSAAPDADCAVTVDGPGKIGKFILCHRKYSIG